MFPTIYNLIMIIICAVMGYSGAATYLPALYITMMFGALYGTYRMNNWFKHYPHIEPSLKEAIELLHDDWEFVLRYINYVVSGFIHALIAGFALGNPTLASAIFGVMAYRLICLVSNKNVIREYNE